MTTAKQLISLIQETFEEDDELIILTEDTKAAAENMVSDYYDPNICDHIDFEESLEVKAKFEVEDLEICLTALTPDSLIKYKEYWKNIHAKIEEKSIKEEEKVLNKTRQSREHFFKMTTIILPDKEPPTKTPTRLLLELPPNENELTVEELTSIIEGTGLPLNI
jgi:hypothetical protein